MSKTQGKQRVIVYVDGFNSYYELKSPEWKKYYWIDIVKLFDSFMRPNQELVAVKYFLANLQTQKNEKNKMLFFRRIKKIQNSN